MELASDDKYRIKKEEVVQLLLAQAQSLHPDEKLLNYAIREWVATATGRELSKQEVLDLVNFQRCREAVLRKRREMEDELIQFYGIRLDDPYAEKMRRNPMQNGLTYQAYEIYKIGRANQ